MQEVPEEQTRQWAEHQGGKLRKGFMEGMHPSWILKDGQGLSPRNGGTRRAFSNRGRTMLENGSHLLQGPRLASGGAQA